jgi:hypothetical protein
MKISTIVLAVVVVCLIPLGWYVGAGIGYRNKEATLRASFTAIQGENKADYDAMWKIIKESFNVAETERATFEKAYTSIMNRPANSNDQPLPGMLLAMGVNPPKIDSGLYKKVQNAIEGQRTNFANDQKQMLDIKREHDTLRTTFPGSIFLGNVKELEIKLVTSTRTENAFSTGKDDEVLK